MRERQNKSPLNLLREKAHLISARDLAIRLKTNPWPTDEELAMGSFIEEVEPQVRHAVAEMRRKGYETWSSGFYDARRRSCGAQVIDGRFYINKKTRTKIAALNGTIPGAKNIGSETGRHFGFVYSGIFFEPANADLNEIKNIWDKIVAVLPDKNRPATVSPNVGSQRFRDHFIPNFRHRLLYIERYYTSGRAPRWRPKWKKEIKKLKALNRSILRAHAR